MKPLPVVMLWAAFGSLVIGLAIEYFNAMAGGILPRQLPKLGNPKWRVFAVPERQLKEHYELNYRIENALTQDEALPEAAIAEIKRNVARDLPRHIAEGRLRGLVGSWGLIQYPLSIGLIGFGILYRPKPTNWPVLLSRITIAGIGGLSFGFAWSRAYFGSLGF